MFFEIVQVRLDNDSQSCVVCNVTAASQQLHFPQRDTRFSTLRVTNSAFLTVMSQYSNDLRIRASTHSIPFFGASTPSITYIFGAFTLSISYISGAYSHIITYLFCIKILQRKWNFLDPLRLASQAETPSQPDYQQKARTSSTRNQAINPWQAICQDPIFLFLPALISIRNGSLE